VRKWSVKFQIIPTAKGKKGPKKQNWGGFQRGRLQGVKMGRKKGKQ